MTLRAPTMALLLTVAAPALAQSEPRFCPNRPSLGTSTCTTDPERVLAEVSGVDWQRSPEDGGKAESTLFGDLQLRTGIDRRTEVQLSWTPLAHYALRGEDGRVLDRITGVGDVRLGLRRNLAGADGAGLSIAVEPFVTLPTGTREIGRGDWSGGVVIPVNYDLGRWNVALTAEADADTDEDGTGRHAAYAGTLGLGRELSEALTAVVELQLRRDDDPAGHETEALAAASLAWAVREHAQLDVLAVAGLNRTSPDVRLVVGGAVLF